MKSAIEQESDVRLQRDVLDELAWEPSVDASQIGVTTHDGVVTLSGHVPLNSVKHMAEEVTKRVHRVRAIANEIEVRPTDEHVRDDEDIAAAAVHGLQWDTQVPDQAVRICVEDGWIKAEGTVEHQFQKNAVDRVLRHLRGACGVTNEVEVVAAEAISPVKEAIESAFKRSAVLNSNNLTVEVEGSTVTVTGDVGSINELAEVDRIVRTKGVHQVNNCVTVTPWGSGPAEEWGY